MQVSCTCRHVPVVVSHPELLCCWTPEVPGSKWQSHCAVWCHARWHRCGSNLHCAARQQLPSRGPGFSISLYLYARYRLLMQHEQCAPAGASFVTPRCAVNL